MKRNNDQRIIDAATLVIQKCTTNDELRKYISRLDRIAIRYSHNSERQWLLRMLALECQNRLIDRLNVSRQQKRSI